MLSYLLRASATLSSNASRRHTVREDLFFGPQPPVADDEYLAAFFAHVLKERGGGSQAEKNIYFFSYILGYFILQWKGKMYRIPLIDTSV